MKLVHECFPKHLRMETARLKEDKESEEETWKLKEVQEDRAKRIQEVLMPNYV